MVSVADRCGLGDPRGFVLRPVRDAWPRWSEQHAELEAVEDPVALVAWTRSVSSAEANSVLAVLAALTSSEPSSVTALVWALLPGAERLARRLADLHPDIDGLVAGQLWIEAARAHLQSSGKVAAMILAETRREVLAELGVGERGRRRDPALAEAIYDDAALGVIPDANGDPPLGQAPDGEHELAGLMRAAWVEKVVNSYDLYLVEELARIAHELGAPAHRGRLGLTSPAVVAVAESQRGVSARTLRRRASDALDRLAEFALVRDDRELLAAWERRHPPIPLTAREELELAAMDERVFELATTTRLPFEEVLALVPGPRWRTERRA